MSDPALRAGMMARHRRAWPLSTAAEQAAVALAAAAARTNRSLTHMPQSLVRHLDLAMPCRPRGCLAAAGLTATGRLGRAKAPLPAASPLPGRPAVHASPLLLRLANRCRGLCQHGHRRQRAHRLLAVVPANPDRIWLGPGRDGGCLLVRLCGVGGVEPADRPPDGQGRPAPRHGARRFADGRGAAAGTADARALASLPDDRGVGRGRQRVSWLFRPILVPAQLVRAPARPGDGHRLCRRWHWLDQSVAGGRAVDRGRRLAQRLFGAGRAGAGRAGADQPGVAQAPGRSRFGARWRSGRGSGSGGRANIVDAAWASIDWTLARAVRTARFWWIALGYFCGLYAWYAVQVHQTKYLLEIGVSPSLAAWALGLVSLAGIPGQIALGHLSDRIGREWAWAAGGLGFAICYLALIAMQYAPSALLLYVMIAAQGVLGYGLTSVLGAIVLEIFQGRHYGSIFGSLMLAALAGGAAGPWLTGVLYDANGNYTLAFAIGAAISVLSTLAIWRAAPRKVRMVAGRLPRRP